MILFKNTNETKYKKRPIKKISLTIEERPERPKYIFTTNKDKVKFIKTCESVIRSSMEYKEYISFLKTHMDMNKCEVLSGIDCEHGKRYTIEIHHAPFNLFEIVDTVISKREAMHEKINPYYVAEEVMKLHYEEKIGLVPLSVTMHKLVHDDKIFIPLQYFYQKYDIFYDEYEEYISEVIKNKIQVHIDMSMKCDKIQSDILDPEFTYVNIEGFNFPEVPNEWATLLQQTNLESILTET
jgi:hypothetical protein